MAFSIVIDRRAILDIQEAIDYYDEQQAELGKCLEAALNRNLLTSEKNSFFGIRYDNVHCLPMKQFPFMLHFTVDDEQKLVTIWALFHTSLNLGKWKKRN